MSRVEIALAFLCLAFCLFFYPSYGGFCDEGPPGRYCFENLTGWHECIAGPKGMEDKLHYCPEKTRCKCFYGPACGDIQDPCGPYVLPPDLLGVSTGLFTGMLQQCGAGNCHYEEIAGMTFCDAVKKRFRDDSVQSTTRWSHIVLPSGDKNWAEYTVEWNVGQCTKQDIGPDSLKPEVPKYFQYQGEEKVGEYNMGLWVWKTGGHNRGQPRETTKVYLVKINEGYVFGRIELYQFGTDMSKSYFNKNQTYVIPTYKNEIVGGDAVFNLPKVCQSVIQG